MEQKRTNPAPLGLLGFGLSTILLNIHNAGFMTINPQIVWLGFFLGGVAQIIAGLKEYKIGNTFGFTAFTAYGLFWMSLVFIWIRPDFASAENQNLAMGFYLLLWFLFTAFMFVGTFKHNTISKIVFGLLALLFLLLSIGNFLESDLVLQIAGWVGIISGLSAFYSAVGQIVNEEFGKEILPL